MKFSIEREIILDALKLIEGFIPSKSPVPSAECVFIEAQEDGCIWMRSADPWGAAASILIHANKVEQSGEAFLLARKLSALLPRMGTNVTFDADKICTMKSGDTEINLMMITDDYNKPRHVDGECIEMTCEEFRNMVGGVSFAAGDDGKIHSGIKVTVDNGTLTMAALDGYRLAVRRCDTNASDCAFVVPAKIMESVRKICAGELKIYHDKKAVRFQTNGMNITVPQLMGDFLNYASAFPADVKTRVNGTKNFFLQKIDLLTCINDEKKPIILKFENGVCEFSITTAVTAIKDSLPVHMEGENVTVGINARYIYDAIKNGDEEFTIKLNGANSALVFCGENFDNLVLPVRVK